MFQGPTLLQDSLFTTTHNSATEEDSFEKNCKVTGFNPSSVKAPSSAPFRIYQDENNENRSVDPQVVVMKPTPAAPRVLMEIPTANVTPQGAESLTDESTVWGSGHTPMASFPNHTQEFALSANLVSTPLHLITLYSRDTQH
ncbi:mitotic checkpoint serine/threonine-protein kinase BUB1 isoform X1, partial [Tachysurus ichikawai]